MKADYLVVGAGFAGSVVAERLASGGKEVVLIDRRSHLGGNAYDEPDTAGILVHRYGPHIFHTNSNGVLAYLSQFTDWHPYVHRVRASIEGRLYPIPINLDTINSLYGLALDEQGAAAFLESVREPRSPIRTSEDAVMNAVGRDLFERFFLNYTRKQWGLEPSQLHAAVTARIPVRINRDDRYFADSHQCMPAQGYSAMFQRMTDNPRIHVELGVDHAAIRTRHNAQHTIYTGAIDSYFRYCFGPLPYRSLQFRHEHHAGVERIQPVAVVNYPGEEAHTRITEFKHFTGQVHPGTSTVTEFPAAAGDPYYPIPRAENDLIYQRYLGLAEREHSVTFLGRLAQYRYYNMDQVVAAALKVSGTLLGRPDPFLTKNDGNPHQ